MGCDKESRAAGAPSGADSGRRELSEGEYRAHQARVAYFKVWSTVVLTIIGGIGGYFAIDSVQQDLARQKHKTETELALKKHNAETRIKLIEIFQAEHEDPTKRLTTLDLMLTVLDPDDDVKLFTLITKKRSVLKDQLIELEEARAAAAEAKAATLSAEAMAREHEEIAKRAVARSERAEARANAARARERAALAETRRAREQARAEKAKRAALERDPELCADGLPPLPGMECRAVVP